MKQIGIIVAMEEELEEVKKEMKEINKKTIYELEFFVGKIQEKMCILVKCGVGKVNAARVTQILISSFSVNFVINIGAAGALNDNLKIGDIVIGKYLVQHDFDITAFGHNKGYISNVGDKIYSDSNLLEYVQKIINNKKDKSFEIKFGIIASGDIFCTDVSMKQKIVKKFEADCVEMEGAAIAQVCYLDNIPFIVIRSISDTPNGNNAITFDEFVSLASRRCSDLLKELLKEL